MARRVAATVWVGIIVIFAGLFSCQADQSTKADKAATNPQRQLAAPLPNNPCPCTNTQSAQNEPPHWYASPEWWLVILAVPTLVFLWYEAKETARAAQATQRSIELQRVAMEQWINTSDWEARTRHIQPTATEAELKITFRLGNPTKFPLTLHALLLWINRQHASIIQYGNPLLVPPDDDIPTTVTLKLEGVRLADYRAARLVLEIGGLVHFVDAFKEKRQQTFGVMCTCGPLDNGDFDICAFTPPDDKELGTRKEMLERIAKQKQANQRPESE